jgi:hypothetical protein
MDTWYIYIEAREGQSASPSGPFMREQLASMVSAGTLLPTTMVARAGDSTWTAAADVEALQWLFRETPPQFPLFSASALVAPRPYSFAAAFSVGWDSFKAQWGLLALIGLLYIAFTIVLSLPLYAGMLTVQFAGWTSDTITLIVVLATATQLVSFFVGPPLLAGVLYAGVRAARRELRFADCFVGFRRYGAVLGTVVLGGLIIFAAVLVPYLIVIGGGMMVINQTALTLTSVLGVVIAIIGYALALAIAFPATVALIFSVLLVVDPRVSATGGMSALIEGFAMTKGNRPSLCGLLFVLYLILGMSVYACCVGVVLFGAPLMLAGIGAAYELIRIERSAAPIKTAAPDAPVIA